MGRDGVVGALIMFLVCILYYWTTSDSQLCPTLLIFGSGPARVRQIARTLLMAACEQNFKSVAALVLNAVPLGFEFCG